MHIGVLDFIYTNQVRTQLFKQNYECNNGFDQAHSNIIDGIAIVLTLLDVQVGVHSSHFSIIWTLLNIVGKAFRKMVLNHFRVFTYIGLIFVFIFSFGFDNLKRYSLDGTTVINLKKN